MQRDIPVQPGETLVTAALRKMAKVMGWAVTSTTNGAHAKTSHHYSGRAVDLAAREGPGRDTSALLEINEEIIRYIPLSMISELIYSGPGNICVKNGKVIPTYTADIMGRHHDHVHLAVISSFRYSGPEEPAMPEDPNVHKTQARIVAFEVTPSGDGYYIVTADGAVFAFGDAKYLGRVEAPVT